MAAFFTVLSKNRQWYYRSAACLIFACALFLAQSSLAQLPSTKPKEIQPTIPDFQKLSADWWTEWPDADEKMRQQWLEDVDRAWKDWSAVLPEDVSENAKVAAVNLRLDSIRKVWKKRDELGDSASLGKADFPENPTVLQWAESDANVDRGRQRYDSLQLEKTQVDSTEAQTLSRLRERVLDLRDSDKNEAKRLEATVNLFLAQIAHLQVLEEQAVLKQLMLAWEEELKYAEGELERMLNNLQYSAEATRKLESAQAEEKTDIKALTQARADSQSRLFETSDAVEVMKEQVRMMNIMVQGLQNRLDLRKQELLLSINQVLIDNGEKRELSIDKDLLTEAENARENISRQLSLRQRQMVGWAGENEQSAKKWWQQFEKIDSGLGQVRDLIGDVERYESAQLYVYRQQQGWWRTIGERFVHQMKTLQTSWRNLANYKLFTISEQPITLKNIAQMILVIIAAWVISRLLGWLLRRMVNKNRTSEHAAYNLGRVLNYCIVLITFLIILAMVGLDTSKLTLIAGALSVGIGFGMQAIFSNFISGIILLFEQPLRVGDLVELESGVFGRIRDINVRSTRITTRDNVDILVPNSEFVTGRVTNHTLEDPVRRVHIPFGVAYGTDPEQVREAAMEAAERVPVTFSNWQRKTEVWLTAFGDSSLDFKLVVWVNSNAVTALGDLAALYNLELLEEFNQRGIEIPYPQRDVHVRSWGDPPPALDAEAPDEGDAAHRTILRGSQGVEDWPAEDGSGDEGGDGGDSGDGGDGGGQSH